MGGKINVVRGNSGVYNLPTNLINYHELCKFVNNYIRMKNYWVIAILLLVIVAGCNKKEVLDPEEDYILMRAFESARNQSDKGIDIEALANSILLYEERGEKGKVC